MNDKGDVLTVLQACCVCDMYCHKTQKQAPSWQYLLYQSSLLDIHHLFATPQTTTGPLGSLQCARPLPYILTGYVLVAVLGVVLITD